MSITLTYSHNIIVQLLIYLTIYVIEHDTRVKSYSSLRSRNWGSCGIRLGDFRSSFESGGFLLLLLCHVPKQVAASGNVTLLSATPTTSKLTLGRCFCITNNFCCLSFRKSTLCRFPGALVEFEQPREIQAVLTLCQPKGDLVQGFLRSIILASHGNLPIVWTGAIVFPIELKAVESSSRGHPNVQRTTFIGVEKTKFQKTAR